jgi:hypothetical protein
MYVLEYFNKLITPTLNEKKNRGEVFTSLKLVDEMLDKFPKKVWKNPYLKWLDPANGIGNFPVRIFMRLMESLKNFKDEKLDLTDEEDRRKHILEKMIYVAELDKKNCFLYKILLGYRGKYKLNIFIGDSLSKNFDNYMKTKWGITKFDIVLGNPPYNKGGETGDNNPYIRFTHKYIGLIKDDTGLLLFITPKGILPYLVGKKKNRDYVDEFYQIKYLAIDTPKHYFKNVNSTFTYFLLQKKKYEEKTEVEYLDTNGQKKNTSIMLKLGQDIPAIPEEIVMNIMSKLTTDDKKLQWEYLNPQYKFINKKKNRRIRKKQREDGTIDKKKSEKYKFPLIDKYGITNPFPGTYYYYTKQMENINKKKVIISKGGYINATFDKGGEWNYTDNFKYILVKSEKEGNSLVKLLNSELSDFLITQLSCNGYDRINIVKKLKRVNLTNNDNIISICKKYNLTKEEIDYLEIGKEKEEKKEKKENYKNMALPKLQEIAKKLNIPTQIEKSDKKGMKKGMKDRYKKDLIKDILNKKARTVISITTQLYSKMI